MEWSEIVRVTLGMVAFVAAGAQVTMRVMLANDSNRKGKEYWRRERWLSLSMLLLLTGIGLGNLTHIGSPVTISTVLISAGVGVAAWSTVAIWRAGKEEAEVEAHSYRPRRGR